MSGVIPLLLLYSFMAWTGTTLCLPVITFNPLKTERVCFMQGLSAYRAVNTLHFGYKNQSLNVL
jgi:hypothetical protein